MLYFIVYWDQEKSIWDTAKYKLLKDVNIMSDKPDKLEELAFNKGWEKYMILSVDSQIEQKLKDKYHGKLKELIL